MRNRLNGLSIHRVNNVTIPNACFTQVAVDPSHPKPVALAIITATPLVGEVVTLHTRDSGGDWETTPLWIVDLEGGSYLRAGSPDESGWVTRARANPPWDGAS